MDGAKRREKIIEMLEGGDVPVTGTALAAQFGVSRQVIVQDIALLRAIDKNIISTNKGYVLYSRHQQSSKGILHVKHNDAQMREELNAIVDAGGRILDVFVEHEVYGLIAVDLIINSRRDVDEFMKRITENRAKPLKELTCDEHFHTIEADNEQVLEDIKRNLKERGFLLDF